MLVPGPLFEEQELRIVWLNLIWKSKRLAWKTAQSHPRRGRCYQTSSHTSLLCCHPQEQYKHPLRKPQMKGRRRLPPEMKCLQGSFLGGGRSKWQAPKVRANTCKGEKGGSPALRVSLCPLCSVSSRVTGFWLTPEPADGGATAPVGITQGSSRKGWAKVI